MGPFSTTGGFQDHNGNHVKAGDRVIYVLDGREIARGVLEDALQDGDAYIKWDDDKPRDCKWNHLYKDVWR